MQRKQIFAVVALLLIAGAAVAQVPNIDTVVRNFEVASTGVSAKLVALAKKTAVAALLLQWILTYSKELFGSHEAKDYLGKAVMLITWFGATFWLIDNVDLIAVIFKQYATLAGEISGIPAGEFTPWGLIVKGRAVVDATHAGIAVKMGGKWFAFSQNFLAAGTLLIVDLVVIAAFLILGLSLFVVTVEFWLIFAVTPLALALMPLSSMREQAIAPLKGLISVGLRILILGVIIAVAQSLSDTLIASINANGIPGDPESQSMLARMLEYLAGMLGCAAMAIYAGKIASAIASGSATFTGSDAMRSGSAMIAGGAMAAAGVAAGASAIGKGAMGASNGAKAVGNMANSAMERAAANPFVAPAGSGAGGSGGGTGFGKPLESQPGVPLGSGGTGSSGGSTAGASNQGANTGGNVNSGAGDTGANTAEASIGGAGKQGAGSWEKFNQGSNRMMENMKHDHANVAVKVNLGADK